MHHTRNTSTSSAPPDPAELRWQRLDRIGRGITRQLRSCHDPVKQLRLLARKNEIIRLKKEALRGS